MDTEAFTALAASTADPDPLRALRAVARARAETERLEAVLVRRARNDGASWAQIAAVLGVSKQAVHKKHGGRS
ncbi:helix-turn-helix domain-containing protein [Glycomyces tenuis]|uniref:helix-turn-helix domain-containing protein n=1 Tax=Glycomyces tenuis TaxID=58116 RepID=UPI0004082047|nr:helix-turn-helix domain-containing protein [Glycomyces tenuis]